MRDVLDLLDTSGPYLLRLLYRVTLSEDAAEDLFQELFLKLQASEAFHAAENRPAYARVAALNLAFDWRRGRRRHPTAALPAGEAASGEPSALQRLIDDEEVRTVLDLMTELPMSGVELLTMRFVQQDSYETIAGQLGKTEHQVRALCSKALGQLRDLVRKKRGVGLERGRP